MAEDSWRQPEGKEERSLSFSEKNEACADPDARVFTGSVFHLPLTPITTGSALRTIGLSNWKDKMLYLKNRTRTMGIYIKLNLLD